MLIDLNFDECEEILLAGHYGHLGCIADGMPHVLPVTYVYKYGYLFSHTYEGEKIEIMRKNPNICIQVERVRAADDWESVICWGTFKEVTDHERLHEINLLLAQQYAKVRESGEAPVMPLVSSLHEMEDPSGPKHVVYMLDIAKTTGKAQRPKKIG